MILVCVHICSLCACVCVVSSFNYAIHICNTTPHARLHASQCCTSTASNVPRSLFPYKSARAFAMGVSSEPRRRGQKSLANFLGGATSGCVSTLLLQVIFLFFFIFLERCVISLLSRSSSSLTFQCLVVFVHRQCFLTPTVRVYVLVCISVML